MNDKEILEILAKAKFFKSYKEMCKALSWKYYTGGNSKKAQFKDLSCYCRYEKQGQKIVILEVFEEPKERECVNQKRKSKIKGVDIIRKEQTHQEEIKCEIIKGEFFAEADKEEETKAQIIREEMIKEMGLEEELDVKEQPHQEEMENQCENLCERLYKTFEESYEDIDEELTTERVQATLKALRGIANDDMYDDYLYDDMNDLDF